MRSEFAVKYSFFILSLFVSALSLSACGNHKREMDEANEKYNALNIKYEKLLNEFKQLKDKNYDLRIENDKRKASVSTVTDDAPTALDQLARFGTPADQWCSSIYDKARLKFGKECSEEYVPQRLNPVTGQFEVMGPRHLPTNFEKRECMIDALKDSDVEFN